ncbi:MAG: carboxypeptidase regulatory-like domain-containing protein [Candidatus Acidiferrales bacterium]
MRAIRTHRKVRLWIAATVGFVVILAAALAAVAWHYINKPISLRGAVIQQNEDSKKQSPITDVAIDASNHEASRAATSDFSGYFKLTLRPGVKRGQPITLEFRHPDFAPVDLNDAVSDKVYVVRMVPLHHDDTDEKPEQLQAAVSNIFVRYSIESTAAVNIGTGVTTFQVVNKGNVPCDRRGTCSPDNRWKAAIGGASLDAGQGNVFENARVSCIAGPCAFTKIESDNFSQSASTISVSVRGWSDTTTFLFQAEVFRQEISDIVRSSYPVIFGRALNFSLPAAAQGPSLEAEIAGTNIVFPLGPIPTLSWAVCNIKVGKDRSKSYRCELKQGYRFR